MAKIQQYSKRAEMRKKTIEGCTTCHGNPTIKDCVLQGIECRYCETCMEVINYNNTNQVVKTKEDIVAVIKEDVTHELRSEAEKQKALGFLDNFRPKTTT